MSFALKYFVLCCTTIIASASPITSSSNSSSVREPIQILIGNYNYTYTPDIGAHRVSSGKATWNTARRNCKDQGGHLAIINSIAEAAAIVELLKKSNVQAGYVGVHDLYQEDEFITIHDEPLVNTGFDQWNDDEPNNQSIENCVHLKLNGKLNDVSCGIRSYYICEVLYVPRD